MSETGVARRTTLAQQIARLFGIVFLLIGILGFIPGITSNFDDFGFAGSDSDAELLGLFQVSVLLNIVHLLFGVAGLAMSRTWESARTYLLGSGILYIVLLVYGLIVSQESNANFIPFNNGDDWLHAGLAIALLASYFLTNRDRDTASGDVRRDRATTA